MVYGFRETSSPKAILILSSILIRSQTSYIFRRAVGRAALAVRWGPPTRSHFLRDRVCTSSMRMILGRPVIRWRSTSYLAACVFPNEGSITRQPLLTRVSPGLAWAIPLISSCMVPMYNGREGVWRTVKERPKREAMINTALSVFSNASSVRLFAVAVDKGGVSPQDPVELAFEELCNRFNLF